MSTPKMKQETVEAIQDELAAGGTNRSIATKLGVATGSVSNVRLRIDEDLGSARADVRRKQAEEQYQDALQVIDGLQKEVRVYRWLANETPKPLVIEPKHGGKGEASAVLCVSDWHSEEVIEKAAVNGVNEFNPEVAERRVKTLWASAASLVDMCKSRSKIDSIVVNVLGDLISGYIHDELMATNSETPAESVMRVYGWLVSGLEFLRRETKAKEIIVPCVCGNHSRFTEKRWAKKGPGTSFEGMLYGMLSNRFAGDKVVRIVPPQGDMTYITVYGRVIRIMHGDNIKYQGGIGGVHIPLRRAIDVWNTQVRADYNYLGHWHTDLTGEDYRISGSLVGYSEWSLRIKARYQRPSQAFELQHPKFGATARFPIILD